MRRRAGALAASIALLTAACGTEEGGEATTALQPVETSTATDVQPPADDPPDESDAPTSEPAPEATAADPPEDEPAAEEAPTEEPRGENQLPAVDVVDINTGAEVDLSSFAPGTQPIVLWFWAPH